ETKEICDLLDISRNNLWVMLYRARMKLRRHLELNWFGKTEQEKKGVDDIKLSYINQSVP
ncbi:hypothetical protein KA005_05710, partial [bacterium]|nr:hypothetical protein [bacterium]